MDNNWLDFGEKFRRGGWEVIKCIINKKEVGGASKVSGVSGELQRIENSALSLYKQQHCK